MFRNNGGGFVVAEFAIALPLLILLMYGLATVSVKSFSLGKDQLADYVLEAEAQYVMERITQQARAARKVSISDNEIKFVYHTIIDERLEADTINGNYMLILADVQETQYFITYAKENKSEPNLYAERQSITKSSPPSNPITGENYFGETAIDSLQCEVEPDKKILHVSLEMESLVTLHKIKLNTAVFMPNYEAED